MSELHKLTSAFRGLSDEEDEEFTGDEAGGEELSMEEDDFDEDEGGV